MERRDHQAASNVEVLVVYAPVPSTGGGSTGGSDPVVIPDAEVPLEESPEEEVPLDATPRTGDSNRTALWASMCGISLAAPLLC